MLNVTELSQAISHSLTVFVLLLVLARLLGRKLLSQMTYFDFVTAITIGTIGAAYVITEVKGNYVLLSPIILTLLVILTGYLSLKSVPARK
ncbi:MAG TPA: DUF421 domain-containing protein, partial [Desulfobacteria bacterium]|nr:DUF421 domain-containing protein [Desulfobacteria bacterium]